MVARASNEDDESDDAVSQRLERQLLKEVRQGSVWAVALELSVKSDDAECPHDEADNF